MSLYDFLCEQGVEFQSYGNGKSDKHKTVGWLQTQCPICGGKHLWLGYNPSWNVFHCWGVDGYEQHRLVDLVMAWGADYGFCYSEREARQIVAKYHYGNREDIPFIPNARKRVNGKYDPPRNRIPLIESERHMAYIRSRGLDPYELSSRWGVEVITPDNEWQYRNRLFFPIYGKIRGKWQEVSWQTRAIVDDVIPHYLASKPTRESMPIKDCLFGEQLLNNPEYLIVVEGVFDAFAVGKNVVATLGKKITAQQRSRLLNYNNIIICFDNDENPETQNNAEYLKRELQFFGGDCMNVRRYVVSSPDPATASPEQIERLHSFAEKNTKNLLDN